MQRLSVQIGETSTSFRGPCRRDSERIPRQMADRHANRTSKLVGAPGPFPAEQRIFTDLRGQCLARSAVQSLPRP